MPGFDNEHALERSWHRLERSWHENGVRWAACRCGMKRMFGTGWPHTPCVSDEQAALVKSGSAAAFEALPIETRLRAPAYWMSGSGQGHEGENDLPFKAADEIERLRLEVAEANSRTERWRTTAMLHSKRMGELCAALKESIGVSFSVKEEEMIHVGWHGSDCRCADCVDEENRRGK